MTKIGPTISIGQHSTAGRKSRNDDSYGVVVPEPALLVLKGVAMAIADGVSSSEAGKVASETCVKAFLQDYYSTHQSWTVRTSAGRVLSATNRWLHGQSEANYRSDRAMICTFSGVVLKAATAYLFHAGDTRVYLLRGQDLEQLTRDHRLRAARDREYLARAFGAAQELEIDFRAIPVEAGDVLVFTTDGVHDFLLDARIVEIIRAAAHDLDGAAARVVETAFANGSNDNLTCQIVRVDDPGALDEVTHLEKLSALPFPPELAPGQTFDGYHILREMHLSKRTQVYLAQDLATSRTVVMKTPSRNFEDDAAYIEMFTREEWVGQLINSPHVLKVERSTRARSALYYVTEHVEGRTLRQWMIDNPKPHLETVRVLVEQIAQGLRAFHRKEILHRDLKPENILIDNAGVAKIIDFGSISVAGLDETTSPSHESALVGTLDYTAPEYHLGEPASELSDLYALAVIAYELLTGKLPYGRGFRGRHDVRRLRYVPAISLDDKLPPWIDFALERATHRDPDKRTQALSALLEDLRRPNFNFTPERARPLFESNPVGVWRAFAVAMLIANIALLFLLSRQ